MQHKYTQIAAKQSRYKTLQLMVACLYSSGTKMILKANKGFLAIGAKARPSQNPDVSDEQQYTRIR